MAWFHSPCIARKNDVKQLGGQAVSNRPALSETFLQLRPIESKQLVFLTVQRRLFAFDLDMINYKSLKDFARYIIKDFYFFSCYIRCKLELLSLSFFFSLDISYIHEICEFILYEFYYFYEYYSYFL